MTETLRDNRLAGGYFCAQGRYTLDTFSHHIWWYDGGAAYGRGKAFQVKE
jgi:hypothetical protein